MNSALCLCLLLGVAFTDVTVRTTTEGWYKYSGTSDTITITIYGSSNDISFTLGNDFPSDQTVEMTYETDVHIGKVHCIDLETDGDDWWWPRTVVIDFEEGSPTYFYNTANQKLSTNDRDAAPMMWMCKQGSQKCSLSAETASQKHSGTSNLVMMSTIYGTKGATMTGIFDNQEIDDFNLGEVSSFEFFGMKSIGYVRCVAIRALAGTDAWLFTTMNVTCGVSTKTFSNTESTWLSVDPNDDAETYLKLC